MLLLLLNHAHAFVSTTPVPYRPTTTTTTASRTQSFPTTSNTNLHVVSRHDEQQQQQRSSSTEATSNSWSKSFSGRSPSSSRFGVRKRVKAVLEKAQSRTGLQNRNSDATVVADAASLGGFYQSAELVTTNNYDSSLFPQNPSLSDEEIQRFQGRNGTDINLSLSNSVPYSGETMNGERRNGVQVDAVLNSGKVEPLPFSLPKLSSAQEAALLQDERIQEQTKMGQEGSGYVVMEVPAPDYIVWECLLDFEKYPEYIDTVRSMTLFTNTHLQQSYQVEQPLKTGTGRDTRHYGIASITRAAFTLSRKFRLRIAAVHEYRPHPNGHYMEFSLDRANRNVVLQHAKGIWYTQESPTRPGYTRVWLLCELKVSQILPKFIVDYAAVRAMPRASTWIPAAVEKVKREFDLKK